MKLLRQYITEVAGVSGYKPVGIHEMMIFYGTGGANVPPATDDEQEEFHMLLDQDEDQAYGYLNDWLVGRGLTPLDIVD